MTNLILSYVLILCMAFFLISCFSFGQKLVDENKSHSFFIQWGNYYYIQNGNRLASGKNKLKNVIGSLTVLDEIIAVDYEKVFYRYIPQPSIDKNTFVVEGFLKKDKQHVYSQEFFNLKPVPFADPGTFQYMIADSSNPYAWARDRNHFYLHHKTIEVDYNSFQLLNYILAYDDKHVYMANGARLTTLADTCNIPERLTRHFCKDSRFIYFYSYKNGFNKFPISSGSEIVVIKEDEIKVDDILFSVYR